MSFTMHIEQFSSIDVELEVAMVKQKECQLKHSIHKISRECWPSSQCRLLAKCAVIAMSSSAQWQDDSELERQLKQSEQLACRGCI